MIGSTKQEQWQDGDRAFHPQYGAAIVRLRPLNLGEEKSVLLIYAEGCGTATGAQEVLESQGWRRENEALLVLDKEAT